ncbi:hypothetical protein SARC_06410 [Sphaeroforma arctica JP610]|uniref:Ubiquitin carboxyl-terminal hydrolase n=1 Tax=Sphaeroforma arctica JP610 TaxID=667725 RepID=A0A0L0FX92_9EUKA|nr:hypothetical protein SARC_06410 [Sphaeroforma arctica JP610]KNC81264.1 hypothetical protein SARC_06410 [Sphaeroforma arctica JP610]|eukprot:XP_014155166.1 hypothetical protein SARC_06410 [Sphaeroforma arctica JP610]
MSGVNGSKIEQALGPAFPPNERYFGLENYGNTCYCNSVLQALYFCPPFRQRILHYQHNLNERIKKGMPRPEENLLLSLAELFSHISSQKKRSGKVEPKAFVCRLRLDNVLFAGYLQQDAHEFFNFLLNKVGELLVEEKKQEIKAAQQSKGGGKHSDADTGKTAPTHTHTTAHHNTAHTHTHTHNHTTHTAPSGAQPRNNKEGSHDKDQPSAKTDGAINDRDGQGRGTDSSSNGDGSSRASTYTSTSAGTTGNTHTETPIPNGNADVEADMNGHSSTSTKSALSSRNSSVVAQIKRMSISAKNNVLNMNSPQLSKKDQIKEKTVDVDSNAARDSHIREKDKDRPEDKVYKDSEKGEKEEKRSSTSSNSDKGSTKDKGKDKENKRKLDGSGGMAGMWNSAKAKVRSKSFPDVGTGVQGAVVGNENIKGSTLGGCAPQTGESCSNDKTWIQDIFEGVLTNETRCLECETVSSKDECFLDLSVDIEQNSSITRCLRNFSTLEYLRAEHKYYCECCCSLQEAEKRMRIKKSPQILALHLKRFKYFEQEGRYKKLSYRVVFPLELKLFNMSDDAESPDQMYDLFAVVIHVGSGPNQGHYISVIKSHDNWLIFDDEKIEVIEESKLQSFFGLSGEGVQQSSESGYILFYHERGVPAEYKHMQKTQSYRRGESMPTSV